MERVQSNQEFESLDHTHTATYDYVVCIGFQPGTSNYAPSLELGTRTYNHNLSWATAVQPMHVRTWTFLQIFGDPSITPRQLIGSVHCARVATQVTFGARWAEHSAIFRPIYLLF